jgi:hypothetical protein
VKREALLDRRCRVCVRGELATGGWAFPERSDGRLTHHRSIKLTSWVWWTRKKVLRTEGTDGWRHRGKNRRDHVPPFLCFTSECALSEFPNSHSTHFPKILKTQRGKVGLKGRSSVRRTRLGHSQTPELRHVSAFGVEAAKKLPSPKLVTE